MTPEWFTAIVALIALVGGAIWTSVQFFATKEQTRILFDLIRGLEKKIGEVQNIAQTAISNQAYYQKTIDDYKKVIDNNDMLLRNVEPLMMKLADKVKV